uniref:RecQ-mediated genome instability protein 1 n=1 Tax=Hippocampus comes TaxID=109280 RepID=A0A3Q2Y6V7_HIPCM
ISAVVQVTQAWLQSSWHVRVPFTWLEACVEWLQEEAGGVGRLSQQQINQQAFDQWLLTDLKDLDYPVLPEGLAQAHKTQLSGTFCVQVDSLQDISQPAYAQLQQWRGTDCANDNISAVTQNTQRPWEAKPTRMLLLQVTDGVQSLEAMEYQPIPALSTALRPGVKLQLQGQMICRLGMLLLGTGNVKVLGGEVEDLAESNNQGRVLCRVLGLPEEQQQQEQEDGGEVSPSHQGRELPWQLLFTNYSDLIEPLHYRQGPVEHDVNVDDFPDEDFVDLMLDDLDAAVLQEGTASPREPLLEQDGGDVVEEMDFLPHAAECSQLPVNKIVRKESVLHGGSHPSSTAGATTDTLGDIALTTPPFTYLCLLDEISVPTCITIKAFIVTLLGKLSTSDGLWRIRATVSDGSGYLDVELSDRVLTGLLGFTVAEKGTMRRDPARKSQLDTGMRRCQEELVDMCCLMTVEVGSGGRGAVVTQAEPVTEGVCRELEQRVRDRK